MYQLAPGQTCDEQMMMMEERKGRVGRERRDEGGVTYFGWNPTGDPRASEDGAAAVATRDRCSGRRWRSPERGGRDGLAAGDLVSNRESDGFGGDGGG